MPAMRTLIVFFDFAPELRNRIREAAPDWRVVFSDEREVGAELIREAEVICGWQPRAAEALAQGPARLRWLQSSSAGVDNVPLDALERLGAAVTSASGVHPQPVAETAFAMLLAFTRQLHKSARAMADRRWERFPPYGELRGRTMAVVGAGRIGGEIARLAQAFGMRTLGVRRSGEPAAHYDRMAAFAELDGVLAESDVVVNVLPATEETRRLFDAERFGRMKAGALFVNVGRGVTVDTDALVDALRSGRLGGAGLDVLEPEPLPAEHPLWGMDNVIVTPHIGGLTDRYGERLADIFVENLQAYLASGAPARNVVDYRRQY